MKHILEEYGDTILQIIGGISVIALLIDLINPSGRLHGLIVQILDKAC